MSNFLYISLTSILVASSLLATAAPTVKSPLDTPAPIDKKAASSRIVGITAINRTAKAYAAVGSWGRILISHDSGTSWTQSPVPVSSDLVAITFPTPQQGWAVGHDGVVLHSADGGKSWERKLDGRLYGDMILRHYEKLQQETDPQAQDEKLARLVQDARYFKEDGADKPFLDVWFENEQSGWVIGAFNLILHTTDAGKTWEPWIDRTDNPTAYTLYAIGHAGEDVFIVGELGLVLRLDREQQRFVKVGTPYSGSFFGLAGKPGLVIVFGLRGTALRSRDAGQNWEKLETNISGGITGGTFQEDGSLVLVSTDGKMLLSHDDGSSFRSISLKQPMSLNDITPLSSNSVIVAGEDGLSVETLK